MVGDGVGAGQYWYRPYGLSVIQVELQRKIRLVIKAKNPIIKAYHVSAVLG